jgi:hypothetical protein
MLPAASSITFPSPTETDSAPPDRSLISVISDESPGYFIRKRFTAADIRGGR